MAELATSTQNLWHPMTCRICRHAFNITTTDYECDPITICQSCSILVDWLGQQDDPERTPNHQPEQQEVKMSEARQKHQQAELAGLLDRWGDLWRSSEE